MEQSARWQKKGEMGMGTLIIFIALVLVAAVAASVIITTTGSLQNKALATGKDTRQEIGTSLNVVQVYAEDGSTGTTINEFFQVLKLNSGSDPVSFNNLLLTFNLDNQSTDYTYNSTINCSTETGNPLNTTGNWFGVSYAMQGTDYQAGYLNKGDVARICFQSARDVIEGETIETIIIPKIGSVSITEANTPDLIFTKRVDIFP